MLSRPGAEDSVVSYECWLVELWSLAGSCMDRNERAQHLNAWSQLVLNVTASFKHEKTKLFWRMAVLTGAADGEKAPEKGACTTSAGHRRRAPARLRRRLYGAG